MKQSTKRVAIVLIPACLVALLIWAFLANRGELARESESEKPVNAPMRVLSTERGNLIVLDKTTKEKSGIRVEPLKESAQYGEVTAYGAVVDIQELLDWMNSYAKGDGQLGKSRAELDVSRNEYLRLKGLHDNSRNVSDKTLEAAQGAWLSGKAQLSSDQASIRGLQSTARQRWGSVIANWLAARNANIEWLIRQEKALIQITVPSGPLLPVPPRSISIRGATAGSMEAVLVSPATRMNPNIQGFSYYYLASKAKGRLLPAMSVVASLPVGPKVTGVLVPASAVVWWQGKAWMYLQRKEEQFERVAISTEHAVQGGWFVTDGFSGADKAVVTGAQLLLSEELRSQIKING